MFSGLLSRECYWLHSGNEQGYTLSSTFIYGWMGPQAVPPDLIIPLARLYSVKAIHRALWSDRNSRCTPRSDWDIHCAPKLGGPIGWVLQFRRLLSILCCLTVSCWASWPGRLPVVPHSWVELEAMLSGWGVAFWAYWLGGAIGCALWLGEVATWAFKLGGFSGHA